MKFIAHRGNIDGVVHTEENTTNKIERALDLEFDVEIDVRYMDDKIFLGHDSPTEQIPMSFLLNRSDYLWIHAKDLKTFLFLLAFKKDLNIFLHDSDAATLTTKGYVWTHPNSVDFGYTSVALKFEYVPGFVSTRLVYGICSDNPEAFRNE